MSNLDSKVLADFEVRYAEFRKKCDEIEEQYADDDVEMGVQISMCGKELAPTSDRVLHMVWNYWLRNKVATEHSLDGKNFDSETQNGPSGRD